MAAIVVGTNSYVTEAELREYATDRGIAIDTTDLSTILIKSMDSLENRSFRGTKTDATQALSFPRTLCSSFCDGTTIRHQESDTVPRGIKKAQIVNALIIDSGGDTEANQTQTVKREKIDVLEVEYMDGSSSATRHVSLENILKPYLNNTGGLRTVRV